MAIRLREEEDEEKEEKREREENEVNEEEGKKEESSDTEFKGRRCLKSHSPDDKALFHVQSNPVCTGAS